MQPADVVEIPGDIYVLAVNQAIRSLKRCDGWITVDPGKKSREIISDRKDGVTYYAAVPEDFGNPIAKVHAHRLTPAGDVVYLHRLLGDGVRFAKKTLSEDRTGINTGNSAWGALGLAYHLGAKRIAMLGVDGTTAAYGLGEGSPAWDFNHLPGLFESAVPQLAKRGIEVVNGSPKSLVTCFRRTTPAEAIAWLNS